MTVLLIGNSLTAGNLGIPYSRFLNFPEDDSSEHRIINRGRDGDTLLGVGSRLEEALKEDVPDVLVIQTGANDILLPEMASRGGLWTPFVREMEKQGSIPTTDPQGFSEIYAEMIYGAVSRGVDIRRIICVTITPIGEVLHSERNRKREVYNREIRRTAAETGAALADVSVEFESILEKIKNQSDWFFDNPGDFTADVKEVRRGKGAMGLSQERGLYLTMDGAHLNEKGAELMGKVISSAIAMEAVPRRVR
ncbi:MAG: hypothetical protein DRP60_13270 [Spirochaetes bacterium]|nr:MAG: hypothetical protein DRP60_13270 [Spirochaetota bacterium]